MSEELSRKERKKLEAQKAYEAEILEMQKQAGKVHEGDSPFAVNCEQDNIAEGSRNIILNKVSVSVNGKNLFTDTTVKFSAGSRYGLMGPNGKGKSTILRLLATRELPVQKSLAMMLVEQEQEIEGGDLTCVEAVLKSHKLLQLYETECNKLRQVQDLSDEQMSRLQFLENELILMNADAQEATARKILFGLGFPADWQDRPTKSFSGGWRKRIALASAVFIAPDVLFLDEPTNHLDLNAVIWLESYLEKEYNENHRRPKILIVVSHDAGFLDAVCTHIVHIENYRLHYYRGGYSQFESQLSQTHTEADKKHHQIQRQINQKKRELHWSNAQVETWLKEQVRAGKIDAEFLEKREEYTVTFPFQDPPELRDGSVIELKDVSFNYPGGPTLFEKVTCGLWTNSRITICGPNGIGKSTLLNLMTGVLNPVTGFINLNRQVRIGRYNQHFMDKLPLEKTPVEFLISLGLRDEFEARGLLGSFGLEGVCHHQMCASLSGGQKARVALASISVQVPHFILFDEPTNHLDLESIEALCEAINNFKGGVLCVTHDARLISRTNMQLWVVGNKNVEPFKGGLEDYKKWIQDDFERQEKERERLRALAAEQAKKERELGGKEAYEKHLAAEAEKEKNKALDIFAAIDSKNQKEKKEKKEKKDKKNDDDDDAEGDDKNKDKKEKKEKKEKKDKKDKE
jgi:ATP-binding cassette, subfamily F, member 1